MSRCLINYILGGKEEEKHTVYSGNLKKKKSLPQTAYKSFFKWFYLPIIGCCWTMFSHIILICAVLPLLAFNCSYYMLENRPRNIYGMVCYSCLLAPPNTKECKCSDVSMHFIWFWLKIIWKLNVKSFSDDNYVQKINPAPVKQFLFPASLANKGRECLSFEEKSESLILGSTIAHLLSSFHLLRYPMQDLLGLLNQ